MTKIIPLSPNKAYSKTLYRTIRKIEDYVEADIETEIINLATEGKWKQWSDEQSIGTEFAFTEEMLRDTGDENVDLLFELVDKIDEIIVKLKNNSPKNQRHDRLKEELANTKR